MLARRTSQLTGLALPGPSRYFQHRLLTTTSPLFRNQPERRASTVQPIAIADFHLVPPGHVRPHRRPRAPAVSTHPSIASAPSPAVSTSDHPFGSLDYEPTSDAPSRGLVHIPADQNGILEASTGVKELLGHESLVIVR
jgi:hypothetical protein